VPLTLKDAANWEEEILVPAIDSVQKLLNGEIVVATPSEQLPEEQIVRDLNKAEHCREFCEICERLFVKRDQWETHLKSNKHKRRASSRLKFEQKKKLCVETEESKE